MRAGVATPVVHDAVAQTTEPFGGAPHERRLLPSHVAAQTPVPAHAVRELCGAPATAVHVPALPGTSHASHWPLHALSQQTPSTQLPEPHSLDFEQATPSGFEQVPAPFTLHFKPPAQLATSQQTPSTQPPLLHWSLASQAAPCERFGVHDVTSQ